MIMTNVFGAFDCWIFWDNGKSARYPLDITAIEWYRKHGVTVNVVGYYDNYKLYGGQHGR
jgi:hypothetical protein